jgi:hypothetical protein
MRGVNALLAVDAGEVAKFNTRGQPSFLQSLHQAVHVSYVSTLIIIEMFGYKYLKPLAHLKFHWIGRDLEGICVDPFVSFFL